MKPLSRIFTSQRPSPPATKTGFGPDGTNETSSLGKTGSWARPIPGITNNALNNRESHDHPQSNSGCYM
ncbi:MAG: hypothetical protein CM1200mP2_30160 [Planctomycetaceae bacterium]|nr:MAG: hypothetical protein CM1200mP2_30160 [Planctomycetaceae bacterium]